MHMAVYPPDANGGSVVRRRDSTRAQVDSSQFAAYAKAGTAKKLRMARAQARPAPPRLWSSWSRRTARTRMVTPSTSEGPGLPPHHAQACAA